MAEKIGKNYVDSPYSLRQLINQAYLSSFKNRKDTADKDIKTRVRVESVIIWKANYAEGVPKREKVHTYRIKVISVKKDGTVHGYPVTINLDYLSIDAPVKLRCGSEAKYTSKDTMDVKRICGDFYFRCMNVYKRNGLLFGRDSTNRQPPNITNSQMEIFFCKHLWSGITKLVESGFLREGYDPSGDKKFIEMFK
jgi:hypothetical protein